MSKKNNILIVWDRMGDYHRARLAAVADLLPEVRVIGADLGSSDTLYGWQAGPVTGCGYVCLSDKPVGEADFFGRVRSFWKALKANDVGRVGIAGYGKPEYIAFLVLAWFAGCSTVMFAESWYSKNKLLNWCKGRFLSLFVDGFFVAGSRAKAHFTHDLGIGSRPIEIGYNAVDNAHFAHKARFEDTNSVHSPKSQILLCVARFSPEKNLVLLINCFKESGLAAAGWQLWLVGGGPQAQLLENISNNNPNIRLLAWQNYQNLPALYHQASAFILPSLFEPWGLVVNEAMAAGLPVLVSSQCGCFAELDLPASGYGFDAQQPAELLAVLNQLAVASPSLLAQKSSAAQSQIVGFDVDVWASKFVCLHNS